MTKRVMDIEALLRWAYLDELPKDQPDRPLSLGMAGGWDAVSAFGEHMPLTVDDGVRNRFGLVPDFSAAAGPHPDAVRVAAAVRALDDLDLAIPDDWCPFADLGDMDGEAARLAAEALGRITHLDAAGVRRLKTSPRRLIEMHAILGGAPDWQAEAPVRKDVLGPNGKPVWAMRRTVLVDTVDGKGKWVEMEVDGYNARRGRPYPEAYRKTYLDPCPVPAAVSRAEYEVWHAALGVLAVDLDGALADFAVRPTPRVARPWEDSGTAAPEGRILPSLLQRPIILKRKGNLALVQMPT